MANKPGEQPLLGGESAVVAAAAHELKSPLTLITYIAQILSDESLNLSNQERLQYIQRLKIVSQRSLRLIQHLTVSYRLEDAQSNFRFNLGPVNAREVCEAVLHELTPYAREYNQHLQLATNSRAQLVVANRDILYDVVVNLVDNAIRHNESGSEVAVQTNYRSGLLRLAVHDNGAAISQRELLRLRSTLGRGPQPFAGHAGTSGLGLYIVSQLTGAMGGALGMGRAKQGTTFFIDLARSKQLGLW
jgi:K+-sensing histidine kinase KdpD